MKIEHYFLGPSPHCIYCGADSLTAPMCRIGGRSVPVGDSGGEREPFRSFLADDAAITKRHAEIFPPVLPVIGLRLGSREGVFLRTK